MSAAMGFFDQIARDAGVGREPRRLEAANRADPRGGGVLPIAAFDLDGGRGIGEEQLSAAPWLQAPSDEAAASPADRLASERVVTTSPVAAFDPPAASEGGGAQALTIAPVRPQRASVDTLDVAEARPGTPPALVDEGEPGAIDALLSQHAQPESAPASTSIQARAVTNAPEAVAPLAASERRPAPPAAVAPAQAAADTGEVSGEESTLRLPERQASPLPIEPTQRVASQLLGRPSELAARSLAVGHGATLAAESVSLETAPRAPSSLSTAGSPRLAVQRATAPGDGRLGAAASFRQPAASESALAAAPSSPVSVTRTGVLASNAAPQHSAPARLADASLSVSPAASAPRSSEERAAAVAQEAGRPDAPAPAGAPTPRLANELTPPRANARAAAAELARAPSHARPVAAPSPPKLVIGRLDIIVEAPAAPERAAPQHSAFPDTSSSLYLRRL